MGQQQLILLVLATIIVGLAIVVGIRAFTENSIKSNSDAMMQDAVRIANDAQAWKQKPGPFGGQEQYTTSAVANDVTDFTGAHFDRIGYQVSAPGAAAVYENLNGRFQLTGNAAPGGLTITGQAQKFGNEIQVLVIGLADTTIFGAVSCLGGQVGTVASATPPGGAATCPPAWF